MPKHRTGLPVGSSRQWCWIPIGIPFPKIEWLHRPGRLRVVNRSRVPAPKFPQLDTLSRRKLSIEWHTQAIKLKKYWAGGLAAKLLADLSPALWRLITAAPTAAANLPPGGSQTELRFREGRDHTVP